jgi:hypothetical protein
MGAATVPASVSGAFPRRSKGANKVARVRGGCGLKTPLTHLPWKQRFAWLAAAGCRSRRSGRSRAPRRSLAPNGHCFLWRDVWPKRIASVERHLCPARNANDVEPLDTVSTRFGHDFDTPPVEASTVNGCSVASGGQGGTVPHPRVRNPGVSGGHFAEPGLCAPRRAVGLSDCDAACSGQTLRKRSCNGPWRQ